MTIEEIIKKNEEAGHTFFHEENMRWFRSRVHSRVYEGTGGIFFVTSEQKRSLTGASRRFYSVRRFSLSGDIRVNGMWFKTSAKAHGVAKRLSNLKVLDAHLMDGWVPMFGDEELEEILDIRKIEIRLCPRTGNYIVPEWVASAMKVYDRDGFAGMDKKEFLSKIA